MKSLIRSMLSTLEAEAHSRYRARLWRTAGVAAAPWGRKAVTLAAVTGIVVLCAGGVYELREARVEAEWRQAVDRNTVLTIGYSKAHVEELKQRGLLGEEDFFGYARIASENPPQAPEIVRLRAELERSDAELKTLGARVNRLHE